MCVPLNDHLIQQQPDGSWRFTTYPNNDLFEERPPRYCGGNFDIHVVDHNWELRSSFPLRTCFAHFDKFAEFTTAGFHWESGCLGFFMTSASGSTIAVLVSWWNERVVIDLTPEDERIVSELSDAEEQRIAEVYKQVVLSGIERQAQGKGIPWGCVPILAYDISYPLHSGLLRLKEAEQSLRRIESRSPAFFLYSRSIHGQGSWGWYDVSITRRAAQTALRRIGCVPAGYDSVRLRPNSTSCRARDIVDEPRDLSRRHATATQMVAATQMVESIVSLQDVVDRLGPPDRFSQNQWRYDLDGSVETGESPSSLIVLFENPDGPSPVLKMVRLTPPLWDFSQGILVRDPVDENGVPRTFKGRVDVLFDRMSTIVSLCCSNPARVHTRSDESVDGMKKDLETKEASSGSAAPPNELNLEQTKESSWAKDDFGDDW